MKLYLSYLEAKEAIINRLNLTDEQKAEIQALVNKYPQKASKIDWNKKDLNYNDIKKVLIETSKKDIKQGKLGALVPGKDYIDLSKPEEDIEIYIPLCYNAARVIANKKIGGVEGKWCIADQGTRESWDGYINNIPANLEDTLDEYVDVYIDMIYPDGAPDEWEFPEDEFMEWILEQWDDLISEYLISSAGVFVIIVANISHKKFAAFFERSMNDKDIAIVGIWDEFDSQIYPDVLDEWTGIDISNFMNEKMFSKYRTLIMKHSDSRKVLQKWRLQGFPV